MTNREKVIAALSECNPFNQCYEERCPYYKDNNCLESLHEDALELLKHDEQTIESLERTIDKLTKAIAEKPEVVRCKDCKHWDKTTREAGNDCISGPWEDAVCEVFRDWDSYGELGEHFWRTNGDWFCADGERR